MQNPLFHIGYHRTSTTWFQKVFYPAVTNARHLPRALIRETFIEPRAFDFDPDRARDKLIAAAEGNRIVACEENLSGYLHNGGLGGLVSKEVANRIFACFPDARIVAFIRSQPEIVAASYAQYVLGGGTADAEDYLLGQARARGAMKYWYKAPMFAFEHFAYRKLIEHYASLFGRERVHIRLYEDFRHDNAGFLEEFSTGLGLDVDIAGLPSGKVNASLPPRSIAVLRRLNHFTERSVQNKHVMMDMGKWYERRWRLLNLIERVTFLREAPAGHVPLSDDVLQIIHETYASDNAALANDWNLPLREHGYPL